VEGEARARAAVETARKTLEAAKGR